MTQFVMFFLCSVDQFLTVFKKELLGEKSVPNLGQTQEGLSAVLRSGPGEIVLLRATELGSPFAAAGDPIPGDVAGLLPPWMPAPPPTPCQAATVAVLLTSFRKPAGTGRRASVPACNCTGRARVHPAIRLSRPRSMTTCEHRRPGRRVCGLRRAGRGCCVCAPTPRRASRTSPCAAVTPST